MFILPFLFFTVPRKSDAAGRCIEPAGGGRYHKKARLEILPASLVILRVASSLWLELSAHSAGATILIIHSAHAAAARRHRSRFFLLRHFGDQAFGREQQTGN